ncbi:MAG: hypothetical protein HY360_14695 [Verrucomicrobia bacterium]|nr:hypothetical protein [Verrucomicrobiota bacterium]
MNPIQSQPPSSGKVVSVPRPRTPIFGYVLLAWAGLLLLAHLTTTALPKAVARTQPLRLMEVVYEAERKPKPPASTAVSDRSEDRGGRPWDIRADWTGAGGLEANLRTLEALGAHFLALDSAEHILGELESKNGAFLARTVDMTGLSRVIHSIGDQAAGLLRQARERFPQTRELVYVLPQRLESAIQTEATRCVREAQLPAAEVAFLEGSYGLRGGNLQLQLRQAVTQAGQSVSVSALIDFH